MILCFSGTGNSRYCADVLANQLGDEVLDLHDALRSQTALDLVSGRPWVIVTPTYAWQLPHLVRDLLRTANLSGDERVYFVMTCGSDTGDAHRHNAALCQELGLRYMGTAEIVMPENYIAMFDVPDEEEARAIIRRAQPALEAAAGHIAAGEVIPEHCRRLGDSLKSGLINRAFYPLFVKAEAFTASDACIRCGKCARDCVTDNIRMVDGKPVWGNRCTHCMACICFCPVQAIEYGKKSQGKPRYHCPETTLL